MKKTAVIIITIIISLFVTAHAYDTDALPLYLTFSEAIGISKASEIKTASVININEEKTVQISSERIKMLFAAFKDLKLKRTVNPTPFSGLVLSIETADSVVGFYANSGIQIGKYGDDNYICYVPEDVNDFIAHLTSIYYESENKGTMYMFPVNEEFDFLKLPGEMWAVDGAKYAASKSLLPYSLTSKYEKNITREEFCILMGNMIAVHSNYKSVSDYMRDNKTVYQKNYFTDCQDVDSSVDILHTLGIVSGKTDKLFEPNSFIAREEAAKMISKSAELFMPLYTTVTVEFEDKKDISDWASFYVQWCNEHSIMTGDENHKFMPKANFTVSEAIVTVSRLFDMLQRN